MDKFIVSARKYRPATFSSVVGQQHITSTLKNAIERKQLAHAYLFCGPRGVGKTTCARIVAKAINCLNPTPDNEACNECESCRAFNNNASFNIHELDAASNNSVEDIRELSRQVLTPPQIGKYSIYIIDEVHMLSSAAFNAFLKTLEEPPEYAIFILATTEKHKILPTILSRCQIYDFKRIKVEDVVNYLEMISGQENVKYDEESLTLIAQKADGCMRDALSMYDKVVSFCNAELTFREVAESLNILDYDTYFALTESLYEGDYISALKMFDEAIQKGFDAAKILEGLNKHLRDMLVAKDERTLSLLEFTDSVAHRFRNNAARLDAGFIFNAMSLITECEEKMRFSLNQRLISEITLLKISNLRGKCFDAPEKNEATLPEKNIKDSKAISGNRKVEREQTSIRGAVPPVVKAVPETEPKDLAVSGKKETVPDNISGVSVSAIKETAEALTNDIHAPEKTGMDIKETSGKANNEISISGVTVSDIKVTASDNISGVSVTAIKETAEAVTNDIHAPEKTVMNIEETSGTANYEIPISVVTPSDIKETAAEASERSEKETISTTAGNIADSTETYKKEVSAEPDVKSVPDNAVGENLTTPKNTTENTDNGENYNASATSYAENAISIDDMLPVENMSDENAQLQDHTANIDQEALGEKSVETNPTFEPGIFHDTDKPAAAEERPKERPQRPKSILNIPSLSNIMNGAGDDKTTSVSVKEEQERQSVPAGQEELTEACRKFSERIKAKRQRMAIAFSEAKVEGNVIRISVENAILAEEINNHKSDILRSLCETGNITGTVECEVKVEEHEQKETVVFTNDISRFKHLNEVNPKLEKLTKTFDLEFNY